MPDPLIPLRRPAPPIRHPADVAQLRAALEARGYTASDTDIEWAWGQYSEDLWASGWHPVGWEVEVSLLRKLRRYLEPEGPADAPA